MSKEEKHAIRYEAIRHRDKINPLDGLEDPEKSVSVFLENIDITPKTIVAGYWPKGKEFDVRYILDALLDKDIKCTLPVVQQNSKVLKFALWSKDSDLTEGTFGILEPKDKTYVEPDVVLIPMLAFDQGGNRIGYGNGYYDATLSDLRQRKPVLAVGVAYAQQAVLLKLPTEDHDEKLDWVVTPQYAKEY